MASFFPGCFCEYMQGPLQRATEAGDIPRLEALLDRGANPNNYTCGRGHPLTFAAQECNLDAVRLLLDAGASTTHSYAELALRRAVGSNFGGCSVDLIEMLVQAGISPNANYYLGDSILMGAVRRNDASVVRLLLDQGASPEQVGRYEGWVMPRLKETTPLILAASLGNREIVRLLLEYRADPARVDVFGYTAKRVALENGHFNVAELF